MTQFANSSKSLQLQLFLELTQLPLKLLLDIVVMLHLQAVSSKTKMFVSKNSFRLTFEDVVLSDPLMGDCINDTMTIFGVDFYFGTVLCGDLSGQESKNHNMSTFLALTFFCTLVHLDVSNPNYQGNQWIDFNLASNVSSVSRYRIQVTQLPCEDTSSLAPPGCLTYDTDLAGTITSFNYADGAGQMLNNLKLSHCIKYQEGYCDVSLLASEFDIGNNHDTGDSLLIGTTFLTGTNFGIDGTLLCKKTGNFSIKMIDSILCREFYRFL